MAVFKMCSTLEQFIGALWLEFPSQMTILTNQSALLQLLNAKISLIQLV